MNIRKLVLLIIYNALIGQTIQSQVSAGSDFTICKCDGSTRLNGKYTGDPNVCVGGLKYKWTSAPVDNTLLKNDEMLSPNICPQVNTTYSLTINGQNDEVEVTHSIVDIDLDANMDGNIDETDETIEEEKKGMIINVNNDKSDGTNMDMKDNTLKFVDFQNDKDNYRIGKVIIRKTEIASGNKLVIKVSDKNKVRVFDQLIETGVNATEKIGPASTTIEYEIPKVDIQANDLNYWVETIDDGIFEITLELRNSGNMIICSDLIRVVGNIDNLAIVSRNYTNLYINKNNLSGIEAKIEGEEPLTSWVSPDKIINYNAIAYWISLQNFNPLYWIQAGNFTEYLINGGKRNGNYLEINTPLGGHQRLEKIGGNWEANVTFKIEITDLVLGKVEAYINGEMYQFAVNDYFKTAVYANYQISSESFQSINRNPGLISKKAKISGVKIKDINGWINSNFTDNDIRIDWYNGELIKNGNGQFNKQYIDGTSFELWDSRDW